MFHELKKIPRRHYGPRAVLVVVFLAALVAGLAILRFVYEIPSTNDAHLLFNGKVIATMEPRMAKEVLEGMPATVTIEGFDAQKFLGVVQVVEQENEKETLLMIKLKNPPDDVHPPVACSVTIDTSARLRSPK